MDSNEVVKGSPANHKKVFGLLGAGLAIALAGNGYMLMRSNDLQERIARSEGATQVQLSKLHEADAALRQAQEEKFSSIVHDVKTVSDSATSANVAIKRTRTDAQLHSDEVARQLAEQNDQVTKLKDTTTSQFSEFSTNVDGVKANVETVKANVEGVKADVASTQTELAKTGADLKRVMGDMGVMGGLVATNSKDLDALRALGERNYFEFDLSKSQGSKRVGDITLTLKKADMKRNKFNLDVLADDKHLEKKDKTINEPVQLYVAGNMQPYEIVVNQVTKDRVTGYLATPKVKTARR
jgi:phage shock protein A